MIDGDFFEKTPLEYQKIKFIYELLYYDMPLLWYIQINNEDYLEYWIDGDDNYRYSLIIKTNIDDIKTTSLREIILKSDNIILAQYNSSDINAQNLYKCVGQIPEKYLPKKVEPNDQR